MHTSAEASAHILSELQALGVRLSRGAGSTTCGQRAQGGEAVGRSGGAGPSDHRALTLGSETIMVPVYNHAAERSPYELREDLLGSGATLLKHGEKLARVSFVAAPRCYALRTKDGIPYHHIATLHSRDVLATTLLKHCVRYGNRSTSCQFCAIGQSLAQGRTIAKKSPAQLCSSGQYRRIGCSTSQVHEVADMFPARCDGCHAALPKTPDPTPARHQYIELAPLLSIAVMRGESHRRLRPAKGGVNGYINTTVRPPTSVFSSRRSRQPVSTRRRHRGSCAGSSRW